MFLQDRECTKCHRTFPQTAEHWYRNGTSWRSWCKACMCASVRAYYAEHRQRKRAYGIRYYAEHRQEKIAQKRRAGQGVKE